MAGSQRGEEVLPHHCFHLWLRSSRVPFEHSVFSFSALLQRVQTLVLGPRARGQLSYSPSFPLPANHRLTQSFSGWSAFPGKSIVSWKRLSPRFRERWPRLSLKQRTQLLIREIVKIHMLVNIRMRFQGGFKHLL